MLSAFAVPHRHRSKVLLLGILAALGMRAVFLTAGAKLVQRFSIVFLGFGALLIYTAIRLLRTHDTPPEITNTRVMRWARQRLPIAEHTTSPQDGALLVHRHGKPAVTRLGLAVLALLAVDVMFALDSLPAIVSITQNLYLVLTTNAFALLGLRALYVLLVGLLNRLAHLRYGLALVLGLIGIKHHPPVDNMLPMRCFWRRTVGSRNLWPILCDSTIPEVGQTSSAADRAVTRSP